MAGGTHRFDIVNGKQLVLLIIPILTFVLSSAAVAARWYTRSVRRINTVVEDALCLSALAMSFCIVTLVYILVFLCGEGLMTSEIENNPKQDFDAVKRYWLRMQFALDICWATSIVTVQLAFMKFYARIYCTIPLARIGCYVTMGLMGIWYVWSVVAWAVRCHPPGKCSLLIKRNCIVIGALHVFFNAVILLAPLPAIFKMQLSKKMKASTMVLILLGCLCTVAATFRIDCAIDIFGDINEDPINVSWWRVCFSPIEVAVGIICCCLPTVSQTNFWRREGSRLPAQGTGLRRLKLRSTSGSSSTSNLHPANWMPGPKPQANAFVTLESGMKSSESVVNLGRNEIKVTKDYQLARGRL